MEKLIGVSERKLRHWEVENDVSTHTELNEENIDEIITELLTVSPNSGERMIFVGLKARGLRIRRQQVRDSLNRVRPERLSMSRKIKRRVYNVAHPNALW